MTTRPGTAREVFAAFLVLGLTSFGGPVAHLGYFRSEFVERRRWLDDARYGDLVALCQLLPGPASSQVGIALGLGRAGWTGAFAAWLGFTLPSAGLLIAFAYGVTHGAGWIGTGLLHGLKIAAVAVVAQALWGMSRSLCPDGPRAAIAILAAIAALLVPSAFGQVGAIVAGSLLGRFALPGGAPVTGPLPAATDDAPFTYPVSRRTGAALLIAAGAGLAVLPLMAAASGSMVSQAFATFYQAGALVFGGGHVVLPLLQAGVVPPGWITQEAFVAGYGAAQAVPGPLFTFAAYLGAMLPAPLGGLAGGLAMLTAIFLPAFLLVTGALPFWQRWQRHPAARRTIAGINAAVVGLLGAAFYDPVWTSAIHGRADVALALAAFGLLVFARWSPFWVVALTAAAGALGWAG